MSKDKTSNKKKTQTKATKGKIKENKEKKASSGNAPTKTTPSLSTQKKTERADKPATIKKSSSTKNKELKTPEPQTFEQIQKILGKNPVILQVLPELKSGGVERGTIEIAKAGTQLGYEMIVASSGGHLVGQLENVHATHITLPLASKNPFVIFANISRIKKLIKKYKIDIIHARSRAPAWSAYFAARKCKCHFLTTFHGTYSYESSLKKLYNSVMTKGEVVIAISDFIRKHIINDYNIDPAKIITVPRGVDFEQFTREKVHKIRIINMASQFRIELDVPVILLPARFTRWKGHSFLIEALSLLKDENFVCIFAGYDKKHEAYYHELEKLVQEHNLFHKVRMIGEVRDMPALYSLSDIVISASLRPEAFGRIAIEGQAMEKLVIATNHGGSTETIKHEETGWLIEPGDTKALAAILKELLSINVKQRKTITTNARKNVEANFSMESMVSKTFAVYNSVLGKK